MKFKLMSALLFLQSIMNAGGGYSVKITNNTIDVQLKFVVNSMAARSYCKDDPFHPIEGVIEPGATINVKGLEKAGLPCCIKMIHITPLKRTSKNSSNDLPIDLEYLPDNKCGSARLTVYEALKNPQNILVAVESN